MCVTNTMQIMWAAKARKLNRAPTGPAEAMRCDSKAATAVFVRNSATNCRRARLRRPWLDRVALGPWQHEGVFLSTSVRNLGKQGIAADLLFVSGKSQATARVHRSAQLQGGLALARTC